jgi:hypothetical protein
MSWVTENKFLAGFGAVMLAGVGTLGYLTWSAMGKYEEATGAFDSASSELKRLLGVKPSLTDAHLKELLAQKQELTEKIGDFQKSLKARVLPIEPGIKPAQFQDKLKISVSQISASAAAARVERPKDFYMGFGEYQSKPPDEKITPVLARELHAIELVMDVLIKTAKTDHLELNEFHRDPLPEEGRAKADDGRRRNTSDRSDRGLIDRNGLRIKFTSSDEALRKILTGLANHPQQLFIIRNVMVQNKQPESPQRLGALQPFAPTVPAAEQPPATPATPAPETPPEALAPAPATPPEPAAPAAPAPPAHEGPLTYVFGTEKIVSTIEIEVLNVEEPKATSKKDEKKKNKEK